MLERTTDRAKGKWFGVLTALGVDRSFLTGRHTPCPSCGGKDRFRFDDKDGEGTFFCSQCGAGNGLMLVMKLKGMEFKEAADAVDRVVGAVKPEPRRAALTDEEKRTAMNRLWRNSTKIIPPCPAGLYLARRTGITEYPSCLRSALGVKYRAERSTYHPAMIAMITSPNGTPCMLHRTFLTMDGRKADLPEPRRMMPGSVARGAAIRLAEPVGEILGIAEGVETALSASALTGFPCWSAVNEGLLAQWEPPEGPTKIIIFGDRDPNYVGQAVAYALAKRLVNRKYEVEVRIPVAVKDWNDEHQVQRSEGK